MCQARNSVPNARLDDAAEDPALGSMRDDFAEHLRTKFSPLPVAAEPMLTAAGFTIVTANFDSKAEGAYTCACGRTRAHADPEGSLCVAADPLKRRALHCPAATSVFSANRADPESRRQWRALGPM